MKKIAESVLGQRGAMISHSKSGYVARYPTHQVVFNADICVFETPGNPALIWEGDLDLTLSSDKLQKLADALSRTVYVMHEGPRYWLCQRRAEDVAKSLRTEAAATFASKEVVVADGG
jgi:hypothetical protein